MNDEWHSGPPPSLGWYPASITESEGVYRWWDGARWSEHSIKTHTAETAAIYAQRKAVYFDKIKWKHRPSDWPERSRT